MVLSIWLLVLTAPSGVKCPSPDEKESVFDPNDATRVFRIAGVIATSAADKYARAWSGPRNNGAGGREVL